MRVGVVIIGSLLWEDTPVRSKWRRERLLTASKTAIRVPIRYGRLSGAQRGHCYTMVFEPSRRDRLGSAWVVPTAHPTNDIPDLLNEAAALATAEGMASTCVSWSAVGLWERANFLNADQLRAWREGLVTNRGHFEKLCSTCPLTAEGRITIPWPEFLESERAADFDVLLAAVTEPTPSDQDGPTPEEIVGRMREDKEGKGRAYFFGNRSSGIATFQDLAILGELERNGFAAEAGAAGRSDVEVWAYLDRFLGYGPSHPTFVFVGLEERAEKSNGDEERNLGVRISRPDLFGGARGDKNRALAALYPDRRADAVPQWTIAAGVIAEVRRLLGEPLVENELEALGTEDGDAFLAELLPVPRAGGSKFPIQRFALKSETAYHRASLGRNAAGKKNAGRRSTDRWLALENLMRRRDGNAAPKFVVCYGLTWRAVYEQLVGAWVGDVQRDLEGGKVCAVGRTGNGSVVAITGFFREDERNSTDIVQANVAMLARHLVDAMQISAPTSVESIETR